MAQPEIAFVIYPDPTVFPNTPVQANNGTHECHAGTIVRDDAFGDTGQYLIGLCSDDTTADLEVIGITLGMHMRVRKIVTDVMTRGMPLKFVANPDAAENDLFASIAAMGNTIQCYCMKDAGNGEEFVEIFGPLLPWDWSVKA